jgi:hypothetical protein
VAGTVEEHLKRRIRISKSGLENSGIFRTLKNNGTFRSLDRDYETLTNDLLTNLLINNVFDE